MSHIETLRAAVIETLRAHGAVGDIEVSGITVHSPAHGDVPIRFLGPVAAQPLSAMELKIVEAIRAAGEPLLARQIAAATLFSLSTMKKYLPLMVRAGVLIHDKRAEGGYGLPGMRPKDFPP